MLHDLLQVLAKMLEAAERQQNLHILHVTPIPKQYGHSLADGTQYIVWT